MVVMNIISVIRTPHNPAVLDLNVVHPRCECLSDVHLKQMYRSSLGNEDHSEVGLPSKCDRNVTVPGG